MVTRERGRRSVRPARRAAETVPSSRWPLLGAVAVVVGLSPWAIRLMAPETYTDNLVAGALLIGALTCTVTFVLTRRGWLPAVLLLGIAALAHTPSFEEVVLALGLVAVAFGAP